MCTSELKAEKRKVRELRKHLKNLTAMTAAAIKALDAEMAKPSDLGRGKRIAKITNALEMQKDIAVKFGLKPNEAIRKKEPPCTNE